MLLASVFMFGSSPLKLPSSVAKLADRDVWVSVILAGTVGLAFMWLYMSIGELYPDKTLVEATLLALGKPIGIIVCIFYIFNAFITAIQIIWYAGDFFTTIYIPEGSAFPINLMFVAVVVIALLYGVEVTGRAVEIISFILYPLFFVSMVLVHPNVKPTNLLPILENGLLPAVKGMLVVSSYSTFSFVYVNMIFPINIQNVKKAKHSILLGYLLGFFCVLISVTMCVLVLGSGATADFRFPLFLLTNEINVGTIFSRIEALMIFVWLGSNFTSTYVYSYAAVKGLSQLLAVKDYKRLVIPIGMIIAVYSDVIYENVPQQIKWDVVTWIPTGIIIGIIFPAVTLIAALIRKKAQKKPVPEASN
jgi:spore germination protein KB